uniref:Synembryn n=1 Tax=Timema monikensis TaxID=170555 RepID=A0A7R9E276_9NEOP|nr:unnamed protein product [Timema monikensis]
MKGQDKASRDKTKHQGTTRGIKGQDKASRDNTRCEGTRQSIKGQHEASRDKTKYQGPRQSIKGQDKASRDKTKHQGTTRGIKGQDKTSRAKQSIRGPTQSIKGPTRGMKRQHKASRDQTKHQGTRQEESVASSNGGDVKHAHKMCASGNLGTYEPVPAINTCCHQISGDPALAWLVSDAATWEMRPSGRDKQGLEQLVTEPWLQVLLNQAGLEPQQTDPTHINRDPPNWSVIVEALKGLCNLVFNSRSAQALCERSYAGKALVNRLRDPGLPYEVRLFDLKLLFIITALCPQTRPQFREEHHALTYLTESLDLILRDEEASSHATLTDAQTCLSCEVLKVLFNLMVRPGEAGPLDEEEEAHCLRLVSILHDLLLCQTQSPHMLDQLHNHTVNLLVTIPGNCLDALTPLVHKSSFGSLETPVHLECEGKDMQTIAVMLRFLERRLQLSDKDTNTQHENLSPILSVLCEGVRSQRCIRKFLRARVLPPLKQEEVRTRPEEGVTLRAHLCQLLTTPQTHVRDLASDLLFVLCKENVWRMVKYTGYGNAAGFLANRGLLLGNNAPSSCHYSSDSEDSDTEEYRQLRDRINPVTGCLEPLRADPTAHMTEEQKEYEAIQLVNMMDKLARGGVLHPCRVGEDGRPEPVEHVGQLLEELPRQQVKPATSRHE